MTTKVDLPIIVATTPNSRATGYLPASDNKVNAKLQTITGLAGDELPQAVIAIASSFDGTALPNSVPTIHVTLGLTLSAEFGIGIAGAGVDADVTVEFDWKK